MRLEDDRDFEMQTSERHRAEDRLEHVTKRKKSVFLSILTLLACLAVFTLVMILAGWAITWVTERSETSTQALSDSIGTENAEDDPEITLKQSELDAQIAAAEESVAAEKDTQIAAAADSGREEVLSAIQSGLETGESSMVEVLRPFYPDELVVVSSGKFHFVPIDTTLQQNDYTLENLNILETGEYQYLTDGQVTSHKGIDVSSHQGEIDWEQVAADGVEFVFVRAVYRGYGSGKLVEDEMFETNVEGALKAGLKVGVYVYSQAITEEELLEEANLVLDKIAPYRIECPVAFDVEKVSGASARMNELTVEERTSLAALFCQTIEAAGYRSMIYHNLEMGTLLLDLTALEEYDKWFAYYNDDLYYPYAYAAWQYTNKGTVAGISGSVDMNISFKELW